MDVLTRLRSAGLSLKVEGNLLRLRPREALTDELAEQARQHKPELIAALTREQQAAEACRQQALQILEDSPGIRYAYANRETPDGVIVTMAIRDVGICDLLIPKHRWDPWLF